MQKKLPVQRLKDRRKKLARFVRHFSLLLVTNIHDDDALVESRNSRTPPSWSGTSFLNVPQLLRKGFRYKANGLTWEVRRVGVGASLCDDSTFGLALGLGLGLGLRLGVVVRVHAAPDHLGGARLSAD